MNKDIKNNEVIIPELSPELSRGSLWLREKRHQSRELFNESPLPPRGVHLWRYTDPNKFMFDFNSVSDTAFNDKNETVAKIAKSQLENGSIAGLVTDFGGREIKFIGMDDVLAKGVIACSLSDAIEKHHTLVEPYLYQLINKDSGKFEAMNGALWNDGIFLFIPKGITIDKPIHLFREAGGNSSATFHRLLVVADENSELTLIDEYAGGSSDLDNAFSFANCAVEIFGLQNSLIRYISLQRQGMATNSFLTHRAKIEKDARMLTIPLVFGAALNKQNFGVNLAGEGADSNMYGFIFGSARQHFDNHTLHHHSAGKTTSNINLKVVLKDKALSAYTGLIRIENDAKTCEAYQENRNLLLNRGPNVETIPELEILNEDVSCSHGATIGPIDDESIFYLNARGISKKEAVKMIVSGFAEATLNQTPEDLHKRLAEFVAQRLESI